MPLELRLPVVILMLAAMPAMAQINPFPTTAQSFAAADRERMYGSMIEVLESQEVGRVATWASEDGSFGGTSELQEVFTRDAMRCGRLRHQFRDLNATDGVQPDVSAYTVDACDVPDEGWKFAF